MTQAIPRAMAADQCDSAQFISDLTIPDGTAFAPGATFTKTWRLTNNGTCTWTTSYNLVWVGGDSLGTPPSVPLPVNVPPGGAVDLSVNLTAPMTSGHYKGLWKISNASGVQFGVGDSATDAFWADINVIETSAVIFDFVANAPYAQWKSGAGVLPYPGTSGDSRGYSYQVNNPHLEDDSFDSLPGLLTVPQNKFNGYIQATYPEIQVQQGDQLQTLVNCEFGAKNCYVTFRIDYLTSTGVQKTLWSWKEASEGLFYRANIDLSPLAGQKVKFILLLLSSGFASGDRAIWGSPRIVRSGTQQPPAPPPTLTLLPPLTPTATPFTSPPTIAPTGCNKASFVADVTVPDGTIFSPGAGFTKTWRLRNAGRCAWTTSYKFLFYSGEQMGGPTSINIPQYVAPGATVDLTVNMISPASTGKYRGHWILSDGLGTFFGIGANAAVPVWVEINVAGDSPLGMAYDFTSNVCSAQWKSGAGILPCPGADGDANGFVIKSDSPTLEDGTTSSGPGLLTFPQNRYNGYIQGFYPTITVQPGDRFQSTIGCEYGASCYVTYRLDYMTANGWIGTLWSWREQNERSYYNADIDLSPLAGRSVRFILTILATGYATNDRALWGAPRIIHASGPTPVPSFTPTPTPTPASNTTNWLPYTNSYYGFSFKYPQQAQVVSQQNNYARINLPITTGTNLGEKYLEVIVAENANPCQSPLATQSLLQSSATIMINGISFLKQTGADAGAGQFYQWVAYSTVRNNACVSLDFILHSSNPGNFATPPPVFNEAVETAVFSDMVSTFSWLTSTPTPAPNTNDWLTYNNLYYGFQFKYPPRLEDLPSQENNYARIDLPFAQGTNLREKYLEVRVLENSIPCQSPLASQSIPGSSETIMINGISFLKQTGGDGGAGHLHQWTAYSALKNNACASMNFILHSLNAGNFDPPIPVFDQAAESAVFSQMMSTFTWLAPTATPTPTTALALVQSVDIQIVESQLLGVNAIVRGQLPDMGCTKISSVTQVRDGKTFRLNLTTATDPLASCTLTPTAFEQVIALDVSNLPSDVYTVNANGVEQAFELVTRDLTKFGQVLVDALNARNYEVLKILMDQSFVFAFWQSQGTSYTPDLATQQLQLNYLSTSTHLTPDPAKDLTTLLGGFDPYSIMGLDPSKSQALFVSGWGLDSNSEAILYMTRLPDGSLYWDKVLIAIGGFTNP